MSEHMAGYVAYLEARSMIALVCFGIGALFVGLHGGQDDRITRGFEVVFSAVYFITMVFIAYYAFYWY